jgi:hypothetical protein
MCTVELIRLVAYRVLQNHQQIACLVTRFMLIRLCDFVTVICKGQTLKPLLLSVEFKAVKPIFPRGWLLVNQPTNSDCFNVFRNVGSSLAKRLLVYRRERIFLL